MEKKVTIVVPVYNAEKYIAKCLDSILNNTYKNIEVILINDGSKDNSQKILDEYQKKYPQQLIVKEQENKGPAETRNRGLKLASRRICNVY